MFGNPQIDEPLMGAWRRALQCLEIRNEYDREYSFVYKASPGDNPNDNQGFIMTGNI